MAALEDLELIMADVLQQPLHVFRTDHFVVLTDDHRQLNVVPVDDPRDTFQVESQMAEHYPRIINAPPFRLTVHLVVSKSQQAFVYHIVLAQLIGDPKESIMPDDHTPEKCSQCLRVSGQTVPETCFDTVWGQEENMFDLFWKTFYRRQRKFPSQAIRKD